MNTTFKTLLGILVFLVATYLVSSCENTSQKWIEAHKSSLYCGLVIDKGMYHATYIKVLLPNKEYEVGGISSMMKGIVEKGDSIYKIKQENVCWLVRGNKIIEVDYISTESNKTNKFVGNWNDRNTVSLKCPKKFVLIN